jgi:branched-chain amino acid transport system ATP-binding protein
MFGARGRERTAKEARERASQVLAQVGLEHRIGQTASELTIPDLKRLELAKALAMDPELLLLDEVMAGLNSTEVESAMELIRRINAGGVTILVIEHVMKAIMGISDRLAVLHYGKKIAEGSLPRSSSPRSSRRLGDASPRAKAGAKARRMTDEGRSSRPSCRRRKPEADPPLPATSFSKSGAFLRLRRSGSPRGLARREQGDRRLIGANGAGKTTPPHDRAAGRRGTARPVLADLTRARPEEVVAAGIIHVPQGRRLFPGLTIEENLRQGVYLRRDRQAIEEDLEWVYGLLPRLKERSRQLAGRLSGGEQQMCAVGRGLMGRPKLLLIDELSLGLAPLVVDQLLDLISEINRKGTTVLLVEQDVQVALEHAHRGYVLETGRVVQSGPAPELLRDPRIRQAYLGL